MLQKLPTPYNRAFSYGDGIFETIRVYQGDLLLWDYHLQRIRDGLGLLQLRAPSHFYLEQLEQMLWDVIRKETAAEHQRLRLSFVRAEGGYYRPTNDEFQLFYQIEPLANPPFYLDGKTLQAGFAQDIALPMDKIANCKTINGLRYVLASKQAAAAGWDEVLICNQAGRVAEASSSNLFVYDGQKWLTPALSEGCVAGVMRGFILAGQNQLGVQILESCLSKSDILAAEELWLSNAIAGWRPLSWVENRLLRQEKGQLLGQKLQKMVLGKKNS